MRNTVRRVVVTCASVLAVMAVAGSPAHAETNPYTPASACAEDEGGRWVHMDDGHREIRGPKSEVIGDVYLMHDRGTGKKCAVTIKRVDIGKETWTQASLQLQGGEPSDEIAPYKYYAAVSLDARNRCVMYAGAMVYNGGEYWVERERWDNCN